MRPDMRDLDTLNALLRESLKAYTADNTVDAYTTAPAPRVTWEGTLNWGAGVPKEERGSGLAYGDRPCVICGKPAICISPPTKKHRFGVPIHKYPCAEQWTRDHPKAASPNRPDTL